MSADPTLHLSKVEFDSLRARALEVAGDPRVHLRLGDLFVNLAAFADANFDWFYGDGDYFEAELGATPAAPRARLARAVPGVHRLHAVKPAEDDRSLRGPDRRCHVGRRGCEVAYLALHSLGVLRHSNPPAARPFS